MYQRFLTDRDYQALITQEHFEQLFRDIPERVEQAEQSAEMNMLEYLDQYYEIEKALLVGKSIRDYNPIVSYPPNVYVKVDGEVCRTIKAINGRKRPTDVIYWDLMEDEVPDKEPAKYSQLKTYNPCDVVKFGTDYWKCVEQNGYESGNVQIPGVRPWVLVALSPWEPNWEYQINSVVSYEGDFYVLTGSEPEELTVTPDESENWSMIGEYSEDYEYSYGAGDNDYVHLDGKVYLPVLNPNADKVEFGKNVTRDDPRNINVVTHMSRIALYYLHQLISPTNISETRRLMYEDSMGWLLLSSKFKINPQIPRKIEKEGGDVMVDWAISTFQKDYNPYENPWLI